jgi:hypothetical protein
MDFPQAVGNTIREGAGFFALKNSVAFLIGSV